MATVYLASRRSTSGLTKFVAVKTLQPAYAEDELFTSMFIDEARLAALLSHDNIVHTYELGRDSESLYLVMDFVRGENLRVLSRDLYGRGVRVPFEYVAFVISKAAEALDY